MMKIKITDFALQNDDGEYYVLGAYTSTEKADVKARVIVAFYGDNGLLEAYQGEITLTAETEAGMIDFPPNEGSYQAPEGTKTAKAYLWYISNNEPLCQASEL